MVMVYDPGSWYSTSRKEELPSLPVLGLLPHTVDADHSGFHGKQADGIIFRVHFDFVAYDGHVKNSLDKGNPSGIKRNCRK